MQTALLLIDVQQSFKPDVDVPAFLERINTLTAGCADQAVPVVRVFRDDDEPADGAFSLSSGLIRPLDGLAPYDAALSVQKHRHIATLCTVEEALRRAT